MGVDASYVMPYRKGLFKLLLKKLRLGQHYMYRPGKTLLFQRNIEWEKDIGASYASACVILRIKVDQDKWYCSDSRLAWFPLEGVLEVDDGKRYYDRDGSKDNENYHNMVCDYYKELFKELGHDVWDISIHPDYGGSVGEDPDRYASYDSETVDTKEILDELPVEVMNEDEKKQYIAAYGPIPEYTCDLAQAIHNGLHEKVKELLETEEDKLVWLKCAVLAKNSICCDVILGGIKDAIPEEYYDIAFQNKDKNTIRVLLDNKYRPTLKQLFDSTKLDDIDLFDEVLTSFINGAVTYKMDSVEVYEKYGVSYELLRKLYHL